MKFFRNLISLKISDFLVLVVIILLMLNDLFNFTFLSFCDEIFGIFCFFGILIKLFLMYKKKNDSHEVKGIIIMAFLFLLLIVGLIGNIISNIQNNYFLVLEDAFVFFKQYFYLLFMYLNSSKLNLKKDITLLNYISKTMIIVLFSCAILSNIFSIGMIGYNGGFCFLATFGGTVSNWIIIFLCIIYFCNSKYKFAFLLMSIITILLCNSGLGTLGIVMFVLYELIYRKEHIKISLILPIILIGLIVSFNEIKEYLFNSNAPRSILYQYSFITANNFAPLGSGFCTYASQGAAKNYSLLYYQYGFTSIWGLSLSYGNFLMDSYYPMIIGEFGYFGLLVFLCFICFIFNILINSKYTEQKKYSIFLFFYLLVCGIGFGTGSSWGCVTYVLIVIFSNTILNKKTENVEKFYEFAKKY